MKRIITYCYLLFLVWGCLNPGIVNKQDHVFINVVQDSLKCFIQRIGPVFREDTPKYYYSIHTYVNESNDTIICFYSDIATAYSSEKHNAKYFETQGAIVQLSSSGISSDYLLKIIPNAIPFSEIDLLPDDCGMKYYRNYSMIQYRYMSNLDSLTLLNRHIGRIETFNRVYVKWCQILKKSRLSKESRTSFIKEYLEFLEVKGNTIHNDYINNLGQRIISKNKIRCSEMHLIEDETDFLMRIGTTIYVDDVEHYTSFLLNNTDETLSQLSLNTRAETLGRICDNYPREIINCYTHVPAKSKWIIDNYLRAIPSYERAHLVDRFKGLWTIRIKEKKRIVTLLGESVF